MALTVITSGTVTTDGTLQTILTDTSNHAYVLGLDTGAMVNADSIEITIKTKMLTGGTSRVAYYATYIHAQGQPQKYSVPVPADIEFVAQIKRTAGTDRAYPWKVYAYV